MFLKGRGTLFPEKMVVTAVTNFSFRSSGTFTGISNNLLYSGYVFGSNTTGLKLNSYYNPYAETPSGIVHQPQYYNVYSGIYKFYLVKYASLDIQLLNTNNANFIFVCMLCKATTTLPTTDFDNIQSQPYTVKRFLKGTGSGDGTMSRIKMGINPRVLQGLAIPNDIFSDIDADPTDLVHFRCYAQNMSTNTDASSNWTIRLSQKVLLAQTDPVPTQLS